VIIRRLRPACKGIATWHRCPGSSLRASPEATFTASVTLASGMVDIATGSADFLRGTFLRYGLLRGRRVEVEQALNCWSPPQMKPRLEAMELIAL